MNNILEFDDYQQKAKSTAIYPEKYKLIYPALGLGGESGEVLEKVKKMIRDDNGILSDSRREDIKKELGDVLWYIANLAMDANLLLSDIANTNIEKLLSRQKRNKLYGDGDNR